MKKVLTIASAAIISVAMSSMAQPEGPGGKGGHGRGGQDRGGMMQKAWETVDRDALFTALDTDADGAISKAEFDAADLGKVVGGEMRKAMQAARGGAEGGAQGGAQGKQRGGKGMFENFDKDGDGKISAEEHPRKEMFEKIIKNADTDGDGLLSQEEFAAFRAKREDGRGGKKQK